MIDYVKLLVVDCDVSNLKSQPELEFKRTYSEKTGEVTNFSQATIHHCTILVYDSGRILFKGSLHKLYNSLSCLEAPNKGRNSQYKGYNGNQFGYTEIRTSIEYLEGLLQIPRDKMIFQNIELGMNIATSFDPQIFIPHVLTFQSKPFEFRHNYHFAESPHQQYKLKIYNKGTQYSTPTNLIRIELKVIRMTWLKKQVRLVSLADVLAERLQKAAQILHDQFSKVLYYDSTINQGCLSRLDLEKLKDYRCDKYWIGLPSNRRDRERKRLNRIIQESSGNLKAEILTRLNENCVKINQDSQSVDCVRFNPSIIQSTSIQNITLKRQKKCPITGLELKHESENAWYARTTTFKKLKEEDEKEYQRQCSYLLSNSRGNRPKFEPNQFSHLAKQVRNRIGSKKMIRKTGYNEKKFLYPELDLVFT